MNQRVEPFALQLLRRHRNGESVEALAAGLGIPKERVETRLRVAQKLYGPKPPAATEPAKQCADRDDYITMTSLGLHM